MRLARATVRRRTLGGAGTGTIARGLGGPVRGGYLCLPLRASVLSLIIPLVLPPALVAPGRLLTLWWSALLPAMAP